MSKSPTTSALALFIGKTLIHTLKQGGAPLDVSVDTCGSSMMPDVTSYMWIPVDKDYSNMNFIDEKFLTIHIVTENVRNNFRKWRKQGQRLQFFINILAFVF